MMQETPETFGRCHMDTEMRRQWLVALRSGDYKQGHKILRSVTDSYCCLGVLCNLVDPEGWEHNEAEFRTLGARHFVYKGKRVFGALPAELLVEKKIPNWAHTHLIHMNDSGMSFEAIADWIEDNL